MPQALMTPLETIDTINRHAAAGRETTAMVVAVLEQANHFAQADELVRVCHGLARVLEHVSVTISDMEHGADALWHTLRAVERGEDA